MAKDKKSFILYADLIKSIEHLTNEEKGILFNHLLEYVNDRNPVLEDRLILTAWKPIELQLKRDLIKFEEVKIKRSEAGKASAEARALKTAQQPPTNPTSVESVEQPSTNPTDNGTDNGTVTVNDNGSERKEEPPKGVFPKIFLPDFESYPITHRQSLRDWWEYKIEKKQKYKPKGWEAFIETALKMDAVKFNNAVKRSMANNWQGLHAENDKPKFVPANTASMEGDEYMKND